MIKLLIPIVLFLAIIDCQAQKQSKKTLKPDTIISKSELVEIMDTLSSDYFEGRETGTPGIDKAARYIESFLKKNKIKPFFKEYRDTFSVYDRKAFNVIGLIEGKDPVLKNEYIIISAHYDHEGKIKDLTDSVYNGANDNASGVATILNIAKIISENKKNKRSIIVALFTGEELGLLGSEHFANMVNGKYQINCDVNIDMIGSVLSDQPGKVYLSGYHLSTMADVFNSYVPGGAFVYWQNELNHGLFRLSDNFPIYEILRIPSHTFCTFDFNNYPYYHELNDQMDKINVDNTLIIANNICTGVRKISESSENSIKLK
jgi:Zn-dependent M28 family amino/carboxypeptidase